MKVWQLRSSRIANKAARRPGSRCAATSSSSRIGAVPAISRGQPRMRKNDARSAAPSVRRSSKARPACPSAEWRTSRSARCGPSSVRPAARSRARPAGERLRAAVPRRRPPARSPICLSRRPSSADRGRGKGPSSGSLSIIADKQPHQLASCRGDRHAGLGHLRLDRVEPGRVARILGEQAVASAHRLFIVERALPVVGIDCQHQPVEEAPAVAGRSGEQRVHRRRHPGHPQHFEHVLGRARIGAVDADAPAGFAGRHRAAGRAGADFGSRRQGPSRRACTAKPSAAPSRAISA